MRILFSSDWQVNWNNLDKCLVVKKDILELCKKHDVTTFVHCGDFKHPLNPVDVRIVNYAVETVHSITEAGIKIFCLLGNHDKIGMHDTSDDWGPALAASGATVVSKPSVFNLRGTAHALYMVPFYRDPSVTKDALANFAKFATKQDVLVFHDEIAGCRLNPFARSKRDSLVVEDLRAKKYMFCVGGHVHYHQLLTSNAFYVGSPFAHDWGEANQVKGYVLVDLEKGSYKFIKSSLPRLYDPTWSDYHPPKSWAGHGVRVHVEIPDKAANVEALLSKAKVDARAKYKGATITVVPEYKDSGDDRKLKLKRTSNDEDKIAAYVEHTCPESLDAKKVTAYLIYQLKATGSLTYESEDIKLLKSKAKNFLSFKKLEISYEHPGITVVTGVNKDWPSRQNGVGKTSLLQLPPVTFAGETLKGQANDSWTRRYSKKTARVITDFLVGKHKCRILRQRRPVKLVLWIDGKDVSTGIGVKGTQQAIEILTGLSWEVMTNAMYIAQDDITTLLVGTDAARKAIFSRFLNLDRFAKAKERIKLQASKLEELIGDTEGTVGTLTHERSTVKKFLASLPDEGKLSIVDKTLAKLRREDRKLQKKFEKVSAKVKRLTAKVENVYVGDQRAFTSLYTRAEVLGEAIEKWEAVKGTCPTCLQPVNRKLVKREITTAVDKQKQLLLTAGIKKQEFDKGTKKQADLESRLRALTGDLHLLAHDESDIRRSITELEDKRRDLTAQLTNRNMWLRKKRQLSKKLDAAYKYREQLYEDRAFLKYASSSFSPGGLPMHIAGYVIPELNSAATKYSELFADSEIQVQFELGQESVDVSVINLNGGESVKDQSRGEIRIASLIVGFALRETIHPANIMILDEPGEGLDAYNAGKFAAALKELNKLGAIWVTSHNQNILSELADERQLVVTKERGISTVQERTA